MSHPIWAMMDGSSRFDRISRVLRTDAERALETSYDAADCATDNSTDWSGSIVSNIRAVDNTVGNPLRLGSQRRDHQYCRGAGKQDSALHG
jgi:hypothetical protein